MWLSALSTPVLSLSDENGSPIGFRYREDSYAESVFDDYLYEKNLQGDITCIYRENGLPGVWYDYDAWGNCIGGAWVVHDQDIYKNLYYSNPFRYRGYYWDSETGFYYCGSRYYDPVTGRWINADSVIAGVGGELKGYNLFAYCFNNPVNMTDDSGAWPSWNGVISFGKKAVDVGVQTAIWCISSPSSAFVMQYRHLHYARNVFNQTNYTESDLIEQGYTKEPASSDKFHQNNQRNNERNRKYVIGDWFSSEVVFYSDGVINNTPEDTGTFNIYSGNNPVLNILVHGTLDVVPYMLWGNSREDTTTIVDRIIMIWG